MSAEFDAIDRAIMSELSANGRMTNVELSRRVGLTPPPCLRRVQRLEKLGVIRGYRAEIDPASLGRGLEITVSIEISITDDTTIAHFEKAIVEMDEVVEVRRLFGVPDYLLRVAVEDANAYHRFQTEKLTAMPGISRIISHQTMRVLK